MKMHTDLFDLLCFVVDEMWLTDKFIGNPISTYVIQKDVYQTTKL